MAVRCPVRGHLCPTTPRVGVVAVSVAATLTGCGLGPVAKTRRRPPHPSQLLQFGPAEQRTEPAVRDSCPTQQPQSAAPVDPCGEPARPIAKVVSSRFGAVSPGTQKPLAGTTTSAQLSAVVIKANTNAGNPTTRAVMFHLGKYIP